MFWQEFKYINLTGSPNTTVPLNLISTTNQQKVSQVQVKQKIPVKLATLSTGSTTSSSSNSSGMQQMLPYKLSQDEKVRRTSSGYQRLGSDSFSPPSGETVSNSNVERYIYNCWLQNFRHQRHHSTHTAGPVPVPPWCNKRRSQLSKHQFWTSPLCSWIPLP